MTPVLKGGKTVIPDQAIQSVRKNTVALKGGTSSFPPFLPLIFFSRLGPLATPSMFLCVSWGTGCGSC